jgi:heavy metal translocating P-type ATPase
MTASPPVVAAPISGGTTNPHQAGRSRETYIAILALLGISTHLIARYVVGASPLVSLTPLYLTLAIGGIPLLFELSRRLLAREFGADLLAGISVVVSVILGEYLVGSIMVLMLSGGTALEQYATRRASTVLDEMAKRMPSAAHRLRNSIISDVGLNEVGIGDTLVVFPHEICPVDGTVVEGRGAMDESYLTGEPFQISKVPGAAVLSGAINGNAALTITATRLSPDSRYARIMQVMQEADRNRPHMQRIGDRLGAWYTPAALAVAALGWAISGDPGRFLAVLVIATPCPLLIAIPVAVVGAISLAARRGIIIKNPALLEHIDGCRTLIFDKTGTLTYGKPALTDVLCAPDVNRRQMLQLAASLEQYSKHPLAATILEAAKKEGLELAHVTEIGEEPGEGLRGKVSGRTIQITGRTQLMKADPAQAADLPPPAAGMECVLLLNGHYAAAFRFRDEPRRETRQFIRHLRPRHQVNRIMLLSGDREAEVRHLAGQVGISEVMYGKSPEEKIEIVRAEANRSPTLFVGDGINDAPAMKAATVGLAFGQNSNITAEAADAVVLEPSLRKVDELIHIGRRMRTIALQSAIGGMALSIAGMMAAAAGYLPPVAGAAAQEAIDLLAVLNALRVAFPVEDLTDA